MKWLAWIVIIILAGIASIQVPIDWKYAFGFIIGSITQTIINS